MRKSLRGRAVLGGSGLRAAAVVCVGSLLFGCVTPICVKIPQRVDRPKAGQTIKAGAAKVDITPIPGVPMGGYSIEGKLARGVWTRLFARAIYLQNDEGVPLVLVSCDLLQMPAGLADQVAKLVWKSGHEYIGRENIVLAATHTHNGPAGFFTTQMNTSNASPSPLAGFDRELFDFLARRISEAIVMAADNAVSAQLFLELAHGSSVANNALDEVFRNRSLDAYLLNPEARQRLDGSALTPCDHTAADFPDDLYPDPRACQAIDPNVEVLVLRGTGDGKPLIAAAAFFASHPTVLDSQTEVYSSDLFGVAATRLESDLLGSAECARPTAPTTPGSSACPVVALFNGAQGDVSPNWTRRDRADLLALAEKLALKVANLVAVAEDAEVTLAFRYTLIKPIAEERVLDDPTLGRLVKEREIPEKVRPGASQLGGAEDGRTLLYEVGLQEGRRNSVRDEHGAKASLPLDLGKTSLALTPPSKRAPLAAYRISPNLALVTLPGEFTTIMGERVREQVAKRMGLGDDGRVLAAGMAGGHISYITTPEEYDAQTFEGGSNLYGATTGPFLAQELTKLAGALGTSTLPFDSSELHKAYLRTIFRPSAVWGPPHSYDDGLAAIAREITPPYYPKRDYPALCFEDAVPRLKELAEVGGACERNIPEVTVWKQTPSGSTLVADSWGLDLVTVMTQVAKNRTQWCAIWLRPDAIKDSEELYRFEVKRIRGQAESPWFTPASNTISGRKDLLLNPDKGSKFWCHPALDWTGLCSNTCEEPP